MSDARLRDLERAFDPADRQSVEALARAWQRAGVSVVDALDAKAGALTSARLRTGLWIHHEEELLVAPSPSTWRKGWAAAPLHLVEARTHNNVFSPTRAQKGDGQLRCARGGLPVVLHSVRWGWPTCKICEGIPRQIKGWRLRFRHGTPHPAFCAETKGDLAWTEALDRIRLEAALLFLEPDSETYRTLLAADSVRVGDRLAKIARAAATQRMLDIAREVYR